MENVTDFADSNKYGIDVPRGVLGMCQGASLADALCQAAPHVMKLKIT